MRTDSWHIIFEQNYDRVYRSVFVFCGSHELTEDAVQEAFLIAFQKLHQLRDKSKFAPWVTKIAINIIKSNHFKTSRIQYVEFDYAISKLVGKNGCEEFENHDEVRQILKFLSPDQRELLIQRYIFGLTIEEIGELKSIRNGTVKSRIFRIINKLRNVFKEGAAGE